MLQVSDVTEKEALLAFQNGLKLWVRQELGLGKDKLGSSKSEERGVCEKDHNEDVDGNNNNDNSGNGKPRKCPKKSALKEKPLGKALVLGSSARGSKPRRPKMRRSRWSPYCVMVRIGCGSV
ncbi:hypothetical protein Goari_005607 [Gossypium aridum]|uniref:Uncharacterized protein n=1 Tax=Gossypium aridum TaxID=34290 RepID=A0A7J8YL54_GOSAI|nr:hypothetical protein [Gossypium aridum]